MVVLFFFKKEKERKEKKKTKNKTKTHGLFLPQSFWPGNADSAASTFNCRDYRRNAWCEMTKSTLRQEWHNWQDSRYHCATIQFSRGGVAPGQVGVALTTCCAVEVSPCSALCQQCLIEQT